jgi:hypothetical protein
MKPTLSTARVIRLALFVAALLVVPSVAQAQKTTAKYDQNANFANYKTFMFSQSASTGARNPIVNEMIRAAIVRELTAKGLTQVDANPDLRVAYLAGTGMDVHVGEVSFGYAVNPAYEGLVPSAGTATWDVVNGTLVIDLWDNKTDRVVFRGTAKEMLKRAPGPDMAADAKLVTKPVNNGITKIFKKYPVGKAK